MIQLFLSYADTYTHLYTYTLTCIQQKKQHRATYPERFANKKQYLVSWVYEGIQRARAYKNYSMETLLGIQKWQKANIREQTLLHL